MLHRSNRFLGILLSLALLLPALSTMAGEAAGAHVFTREELAGITPAPVPDGTRVEQIAIEPDGEGMLSFCIRSSSGPTFLTDHQGARLRFMAVQKTSSEQIGFLPEQIWRFSMVEPGVFQIIRSSAPQYCLTITESDGIVMQFPSEEGIGQRFSLTYSQGGFVITATDPVGGKLYHLLRSINAELILSTDRGTPVALVDSNAYAYGRWSMPDMLFTVGETQPISISQGAGAYLPEHFSYSVHDTDIVTVKDHHITAHASGSTTITASEPLTGQEKTFIASVDLLPRGHVLLRNLTTGQYCSASETVRGMSLVLTDGIPASSAAMTLTESESGQHLQFLAPLGPMHLSPGAGTDVSIQPTIPPQTASALTVAIASGAHGSYTIAPAGREEVFLGIRNGELGMFHRDEAACEWEILPIAAEQAIDRLPAGGETSPLLAASILYARYYRKTLTESDSTLPTAELQIGALLGQDVPVEAYEDPDVLKEETLSVLMDLGELVCLTSGYYSRLAGENWEQSRIGGAVRIVYGYCDRHDGQRLFLVYDPALMPTLGHDGTVHYAGGTLLLPYEALIDGRQAAAWGENDLGIWENAVVRAACASYLFQPDEDETTQIDSPLLHLPAQDSTMLDDALLHRIEEAAGEAVTDPLCIYTGVIVRDLLDQTAPASIASRLGLRYHATGKSGRALAFSLSPSGELRIDARTPDGWDILADIAHNPSRVLPFGVRAEAVWAFCSGEIDGGAWLVFETNQGCYLLYAAEAEGEPVYHLLTPDTLLPTIDAALRDAIGEGSVSAQPLHHATAVYLLRSLDAASRVYPAGRSGQSIPIALTIFIALAIVAGLAAFLLFKPRFPRSELDPTPLSRAEQRHLRAARRPKPFGKETP